MRLSNDESIQTQSGSTAFTVATSTGLLYSEGQPLRFGSAVQIVSSSDTTITSYGVSVLEGIAARSYTSVQAPIPGVFKTIINKSSTAAVTIDLGVTIAYSTATATDTPHIITFTTQATPSCVQLVGITTSLWGLVNSQGGVTLSS